MREQAARHSMTQKKRRSPLATLCVLTALAFVLSMGAVSLARYVMERQNDDVAMATPFYFVSEQLSADEPLPNTPVTEPESGNTVDLTVTLSNHIDDLRYSKKDINFNVNAYNAEGKAVSNNGVIRGALSGDKQSDQQVTLTVYKSDFNSGPVTVVAEATSPYKKEIKGTFVLTEGEGIVYENKFLHEENGTVVLEVMGKAEKSQMLEVHWPEGLTPDPSCVYFKSSNAILDDHMAQIFGGNIYSTERLALVFLKTDPGQSYDASQFTANFV